MNGPSILLIGESSAIKGLTWHSDKTLRIGSRDPKADVRLDDPTISSQHAEIFRTTRGWVVRDLESKTGTFVNQHRVPRGQEQVLHDRDQLQFGSLQLQVQLDEYTDAIEEAPGEELLETLPTAEIVAADIRTTRGFLRVEEATSKSWEEAVEGVTPPSMQGPWHVEHLRALLRASYTVCDVASLDVLLRSVLQDIIQVLRAQRGSVLLMDETTGELELRQYVASRARLEPNVTYSRTIANRSFSRRESLLCADVRRQEEIKSARSVLNGAMSSIICALLRTQHRAIGVLHVDRGPLQVPFSREEFQLVDAIAATISVGIERAMLIQRERESFLQMVTALGRAVELRDLYTANHTTRVTEYSLCLASALQVSQEEMNKLRIGTPLHDIGKIGIQDAILRKPGRLTSEELEEMKTHTVKGAVILETIPTLREVIPIARHHHERWDGEGYPDGLGGEQISLLPRIVAVADVFDALTSDRPYRKAMTLDQGFSMIEQGIGAHFDPRCSTTFLRLRPQIEEIYRERHEDEGDLVENLAVCRL